MPNQFSIQTDRLILRNFEESDFEAVHAYGSDPLMTELMTFGPNTEEDTRGFLRMAIETAKEDPRTGYHLAITRKSDMRLIGGFGATIDTNNRSSEIGYILHRDFWGQGYAAEALRAYINFGFDHLKLHKVHAWCSAENKKSARVLEKGGMKLEGRRREHWWRRDRWHDLLCFGILEGDHE